MATNDSVSIGAWLGRGWQTFKSQPRALIGAMLIYALFFVVVGVAGRFTHQALGMIVNVVVGPSIVVGLLLVSLRAVRSERVRAAMVFDGFAFFVPALVASILYALILVGGTILLIVPGVIWAVTYSLSLFVVGDKSLGGVEALKASAKLTKGHRWKLFGLFLVSCLICVVGILLIGLGLIVAVPWVYASYAAAYDSLSVAEVASPAAQTEGPAQPA